LRYFVVYPAASIIITGPVGDAIYGMRLAISGEIWYIVIGETLDPQARDTAIAPDRKPTLATSSARRLVPPF
jgi:hypothetical protein